MARRGQGDSNWGPARKGSDESAGLGRRLDLDEVFVPVPALAGRVRASSWARSLEER